MDIWSLDRYEDDDENLIPDEYGMAIGMDVKTDEDM